MKIEEVTGPYRCATKLQIVISRVASGLSIDKQEKHQLFLFLSFINLVSLLYPQRRLLPCDLRHQTLNYVE